MRYIPKLFCCLIHLFLYCGIDILQAMLVHPDKNGGSDQAEEAFKRLQNAYEVLICT